ncbi:MAG: riboflavin synthase [Sphingomonadaceae bacterium]
MFTGIISAIGTVAEIRQRPGADLSLWIDSDLDLSDVALGASIACSGVCLTVVAIEGRRFQVDVSGETLSRTPASQWEKGARLNLERALKIGDELGGHIVTGHVDGVGEILGVEPVAGSLHLVILAPPAVAPFIAAKGSIAVDGISLTVNEVEDEDRGARLHLNIIPHTAEVTTLGEIATGAKVNLEIDILARYLQRLQTSPHTR